MSDLEVKVNIGKDRVNLVNICKNNYRDMNDERQTVLRCRYVKLIGMFRFISAPVTLIGMFRSISARFPSLFRRTMPFRQSPHK